MLLRFEAEKLEKQSPSSFLFDWKQNLMSKTETEITDNHNRI